MTDYLKTHEPVTTDEIKAAVDVAYALATKYGEGAAAMSCEMYDAVAALSGVTLPPAEPAATATYEDAAKTVWGILKKSDKPESVGSGVGRLVKMAGVDTTIKNGMRDGAQFAWIPHGDTCAFCLMLASNGWRNISKKALKKGHAEHIHSNCDCTYAVRFDDKSDVAGYDPEKYKAFYDENGGDLIQMRQALREAEKNVDSVEKSSTIGLRKGSTGNYLVREQSLRTKSGGEFGVDWSIVKSKEYTERFNALSDNADANELAAQRARNALVNRSGKKTEEIYAISLTTGKDVASITDQHYDFGIKRTEKFDADVQRAVDRGEKILLIHNHPRGLPPSVADINELLTHENVSGITVGHDGSIYYYSRPQRYIAEEDERRAYMKSANYLRGIEKYTDTISILAESFEFEFKKI